ncbi:MAG: EcsC family protein, partial [Casimicrobiaceae bacterium]
MSTHAAAGGMMQERSLDKPEVSERLGTMLLDLLGNIPRSDESESDDPVVRARKLAHTAARKAALTSGTLALPPGALGWLTVIPELIAIWKLQAQMVSDIAAIFGSKALLTREHMLYCLFRHTAAQAVRDLVVRMGQRFLVQQVSHGTLTRVARQIGVRMTQHALGKGIARWVPVAGAVGVGAYAYYDTLQVAFTATQLFRRGPPPADRTPRL